MAIIIGDIHSDIRKVQAFLAYEPAEQHICLGDLVDSRGLQKATLSEELACLDLLLGSEATLLWGNHDLAYLLERPWKCFGHFGEFAFRDRYQAARNRFFAAYAVDGWLCTHAGLSRKIAALMPAEVVAGGPEAIAMWLCAEFEIELTAPVPDIRRGEPRYGHGPLFGIPPCRGGYSEYGGIFWHDAEGEQRLPSGICQQVFGHSPKPLPACDDSWINLDTFADGSWVLNTKTMEIMNLEESKS